MLIFNCPGEKSWEISNNGHIKKGDEQIMPHTLRNGILYMPTDTVRYGYLSLTDCFNRTQRLWFAPEELPKVKAALNILKETAPDMEYSGTVDMPEDSAHDGSEDGADTNATASESKSTVKGQNRSAPVSVNFKKSVPEAEKLRKNGEKLEAIGNSIYSFGKVIAWIALLFSLFLGIYWWAELEDISVLGISALSGAVAFVVIYVSSWWNCFIFGCISSFFIGQSCIVQGITVTARTNLYIADKLEKQSENQNN